MFRRRISGSIQSWTKTSLSRGLIPWKMWVFSGFFFLKIIICQIIDISASYMVGKYGVLKMLKDIIAQ